MAGERSDQSDNDPIDPNSYNPLPLGPPSRAQGGLEEELGEMGFPPTAPKVSSSVPLGFARFALPHVATFASISNLVSRTYLSTFDEAILDNAQNALVMRRDPVVMEPLWSRQVLCAQLEWHLEPEDHRDSRQMRMAQELERTIRQIPRLQDLRMNCLEDIWYGRYGVQFATKWDWTRGYKRLVIRDHMPVNGDKLMFRFSGQPAVLVHGAYRGPVIYTDKGRAHPLTPEEREQFIIPRHMPEDADYLEGEMAGKRFGVGLRSKIYWWWYQRNNVTQWMFDFLQTIGAGGLTVYYYEEGNPASYNQAFQAASNQQTNQAVLMPRRKGVNGAVEEINKVERLEPSNAGAQLLFDIVTKYYNDQIRSYIKGELLTTKTGPTGLGSNVAEQHAKTATRITKFDATRQQEYLTTDLVWPLQRHTYLDMPPERCPVCWVFDVEQPEPKEFLDAAKTFADLGGLLDAGQVRGVMGFRKPEPGSELLFNPTARQQIMEMNAATTAGPPESPPETAGGGGAPSIEGDDGLPDTSEEDAVNEPRLTQPDHPPVQNDLFGGSAANNGLPPGGKMESRPGKRTPMQPNADVDNPGRRIRVRHSKKAEVVDSSYVMDMVKNSPQWKARDEEKGVKWQAYADKFGVHGQFVRGTTSPQHLKKLIESGDLIPAKKLDPKDIKEKAEGVDEEPIHEVAITRKPGTDKMLIVDGNHSLAAAIKIKQVSIPVVVDVGDSHRVLTERKRVRYAADKSSWQRYWGPSGGEGWKHVKTGHVRYQKERPTEWEDKLMVEFHRDVPHRTQLIGQPSPSGKASGSGQKPYRTHGAVNEPSWSGPKQPIANAKEFREEEHPRDNASGEFVEKGGASDSVRSYLESFADAEPGDAEAVKDANLVNLELAEEDDPGRIVPDGKGGWISADVDWLEDQYGDDWVIEINPLTGRADIASERYFVEISELAGDVDTAPYVQAFNDPNAPPVTEEEVTQANLELEESDSDYRLSYSKDYQFWIVVPASPQRMQRLRRKKTKKQPKQDRSVFGYIEMPEGADPDTFAQCASCTQFTGKTCLNFSPKDRVVAGGSCIMYVYGEPQTDAVGREASSLTPEEADYVVRPVRCTNCFFAKEQATTCGLFEYMNDEHPGMFSLDVHIEPTSCCDAQTVTGGE